MLATTFNLILKLLVAFFFLSAFFAICFTNALFTSPAVALVYLNQLPFAVESRVTNPNFTPSPRELECQKTRAQPPPQGPIPRTIHYVILSNEGSASSLDFPTFLSIKAVLKNIKPDKIKIHCYDFDTNGEWWRRISHHVELVHHERDNRLGPQGKGIAEYSLPHQADILRLHALHNEGGIYLDTDVFPFKSFDPFFNSSYDALLGHEGANRYGLCNAIIIARQGSRFLSRWIDSYESFDDSIWNFHSVRLPKILATEYPHDVCTLSPVAFFWPTWATKHTELMHEPISDEEALKVSKAMEIYDGSLYPNQFAFHAWGGAARTKYLSKLTPERLLEEHTRFNVLMRPIYELKD